MTLPDPNVILPPDADKGLDSWGWGFITGLLAGVFLAVVGYGMLMESIK